MVCKIIDGEAMDSKTMKTYLFSYYHHGFQYSFEVHALDKRDAEVIVTKMGVAHCDGELIAKVPAYAGWIMRLIVWLRNKLR